MTKDAVVRAACLEDYDQACVLLDALDELHREGLPWLFHAPANLPRPRDYFAQLLTSDDSSVFVADAGVLVGVAIVLMRAAPDFPVFIPQRWAVLDGVFVAAAWRRRGVRRELARAAEIWANTHGAAWLELGVYEFNNHARKFYEMLGYVPVTTKLRKVVPGPTDRELPSANSTDKVSR